MIAQGDDIPVERNWFSRCFQCPSGLYCYTTRVIIGDGEKLDVCVTKCSSVEHHATSTLEHKPNTVDGNGDRCIRLVIRVNGDAVEQRFPGTPLSNRLEGIAVPDTQRPPDADRSGDNPAPSTAIKELDLFYPP